MRMPPARRLMFVMTAGLILTGIGLSGWERVHWLLYVTPVLLGLFGLTGLCPAMALRRFGARKAKAGPQ